MSSIPSAGQQFDSQIAQQLERLESAFRLIQEYLEVQRPAFIPERIYNAAREMAAHLAELRERESQVEGERRNLRVLTQMGQVVNSSIELDDVLQLVMDTTIQITGAERGFLMLQNERGELEVRVARNWEHETLEEHDFAFSRTAIHQAAGSRQAVLTTNAQGDPRFLAQESVVQLNLRSILCVPMQVKGELVGVIYADSRVRSGLFTQQHLELLTGFSNQAAAAIANARLFESVRQALAEANELKNLLDIVFSSIPSGVLITDVEERILLCNRAAATILGRGRSWLLRNPLRPALEALGEDLTGRIERALKLGEAASGLEATGCLPGRGTVELRVSVSPLKNENQSIQGLALVFEDLTETRLLEARRSLFERMVSPDAFAEINPEGQRRIGQRRQITSLFADISGFTSFSERVEPERLVAVLNRYLAAAADAVLEEGGTVDKFLGDAVMAWFSAPNSAETPEKDRADSHALRAVRAARAIRAAVVRLNQEAAEDERLSFGIGLHSGDAIIGLVGAEKRLEYTAIGDSVNTAKRVQEQAEAGQILISRATFELAGAPGDAHAAGTIAARGKREPIEVFAVSG